MTVVDSTGCAQGKKPKPAGLLPNVPSEIEEKHPHPKV